MASTLVVYGVWRASRGSVVSGVRVVRGMCGKRRVRGVRARPFFPQRTILTQITNKNDMFVGAFPTVFSMAFQHSCKRT